MIIADDYLFFVHVVEYYGFKKHIIISIFEMQIEDRLFIPITNFTCTHELFGGGIPQNLIIGLGNEITIMKNKNDICFKFNVSINEHQEFRTMILEIGMIILACIRLNIHWFHYDVRTHDLRI